MTKVKKRYRKIRVYQTALVTTMLIVLVLSILYYILTTDMLSPKVNELTASYISFNNANATDMIKVSSLSKMTDTKGVSYKNKSTTDFKVEGKKKEAFKIVLYHLGNMIDDNYVRFALMKNNKLITQNSISNMEQTNDDGVIIYNGTIDEKEEYTIKMWIDKEYEKSTKNISYEIKIKS